MRDSSRRGSDNNHRERQERLLEIECLSVKRMWPVSLDGVAFWAMAATDEQQRPH